MYNDCLNRLTCHGLVKPIEGQNMNFHKLYYDVLYTSDTYIRIYHIVHNRVYSRNFMSLLKSDRTGSARADPPGSWMTTTIVILRASPTAAGTRPHRHFCMLITLVYTLSLFCNRQLEELCLQSPQVWKVLVLFLVSAAFPVPNEMRISLASVFIRSEHQSRYGASFVSGTEEKQGAESHKSP